MHAYLDNAATTPLDNEVLESMMPYLTRNFGNPSSIHSLGRETRTAIEKARKTIASLLNTSPSEIFFTSGGTESDNMAIRCSLQNIKTKHIISSPVEHHAVLHCLEMLEKKGEARVSFTALDERGNLIPESLEDLLKNYPGSLVSLMHANNEIGNLNDLNAIGELCEKYDALLHSDTVQTVGHYRYDLQKLKVHFITGSAHKFHGPKGAGFLYVNNSQKLSPLIFGGAQERNMRGGTENLYAIVGMAKALEIAYQTMDEDRKHIEALKFNMIEKLKEKFNDIKFNGNCLDRENSLYSVLNVSLPPSHLNDMLLFKLDIHKIYASGGSACSSGTDIGSHVLKAIKADPQRGHIRFSFSKYNTMEEINYTVEKLGEIYKN
jgi:cysteine desulfurase